MVCSKDVCARRRMRRADGGQRHAEIRRGGTEGPVRAARGEAAPCAETEERRKREERRESREGGDDREGMG